MLGRTVLRIVALLCFFLAQSAYAFFDLPWITPVDPSAGDTVSVNIRAGVCDGILETSRSAVVRKTAALPIIDRSHIRAQIQPRRHAPERAGYVLEIGGERGGFEPTVVLLPRWFSSAKILNDQ
jgi:hypothetical protein